MTRRERIAEFLTGAALVLGALLVVVAFYAAIALGSWNYHRGIDDGPSSNSHECRYDPRYGDDC